MTVQRLLIVLSLICFVLAALGVNLGPVNAGWLGLAFFAGGHL